MHELVLSENIVRTALSASGVDKGSITAIVVQVGALSAVNVSTLEFCLRLALDEHRMPQTEVRLNAVPALVECECGLRYRSEDMFGPCPDCGSFVREIIEGKEVTIQYVEVEDEED